MSGPARGEKTAMLGIGAGVLAIVCCAAGPALVATAGSLALGAWLGVGAGLLMLVAGLTTLYVRRRSRTRKQRQLS